MNNKIMTAPLVSARIGKQPGSASEERGSSLDKSERSNTFDNAMRRAAQREPRADRGESKSRDHRDDHERRSDSVATSPASKRASSPAREDQVDSGDETAMVEAPTVDLAPTEAAVLPELVEVPLAPLSAMPLSLDQIERILAQSEQDAAESTAQQPESVESIVVTAEMLAVVASDNDELAPTTARRLVEATPQSAETPQTGDVNPSSVSTGLTMPVQTEVQTDPKISATSVVSATALANASALVQTQLDLSEGPANVGGEPSVNDLVEAGSPAPSSLADLGDSSIVAEKFQESAPELNQPVLKTVAVTKSVGGLGIAESVSASVDPSGVTTSPETSSISHAEAAELAALDEDGSADSVMRQVKRAIGSIRNAGGGDHEFKIRLVPRDLGSVTIGIQTSEAGIAIGLVTETSAASDRLNEQRQQLMDELAESGLDSSNVDISHEGQNQNQFGGDAEPDGSESNSARAAGSSASPPTGDSLKPGSQRAGANRSRTPGRVDVAL